MKLNRIKDRELLDKYHSKPCLICNRRPSDPCHIRSRGAGGPDLEWNILPLCREHHQMQHAQGWWKLVSKFSILRFHLSSNGWKFDETKTLWNDLLSR